MSNVKPKMDLQSTHAFLESRYRSQVSDLQVVSQGETSQTYTFRHQDCDYVIRFNHYEDGFLRDKYAFETLAIYNIPIPRIIDIGNYSDLFYCISERVRGNILFAYKPNQIEVVIPNLLYILMNLNSVDLDASRGYGPINRSGDGVYQSWVEYLGAAFAENQDGFWSGWMGLFDDTFLERDVFEVLRDRMMKYAAYCNSIREFVHGDLSLDNLLSDGQVLTGIIDWGNACYGDGLYDIARFHFWTPVFDLPKRFLQCCNTQGIQLPHFEERLLCHTYFQGLDALRFYAKTARLDAYTQVRDNLLSLEP